MIKDILLAFNNGWGNGDWHLLVVDLYHEQPPEEKGAIFGFMFGVFGFDIRFVIYYEK